MPFIYRKLYSKPYFNSENHFHLKFYYSLISKCKASRILNDFIYSLTRQKMKAKVPIMAEIGLEENSSNRIKENTKESDFRQLYLDSDSLEVITSLQGTRILFLSLFSSGILKQLNNRGVR